MPELTAPFDRHARAYREQHAASTRLAGEPVEFFAQYKIARLSEAWQSRQRRPEAILDFGTGIGNSLRPLHAAFPEADIIALDVSRASLDQADALGVPRARTLAYDGHTIPLDDRSVDCAFTACVFHHVPATQHVALLKEIRRVLRPGGLFMLFEHNPLNPLTRLAVARCPFDDDAVLIGSGEMRRRLQAAGFSQVAHSYCLFFPKALAALRPLEGRLAWLPLGAQYFLTAS